MEKLITVEQLVKDLKLRVLCGKDNLLKTNITADIYRPGIELTGYLLENNPARKRLIASYIYDLQEKIRHNEMSTKRHILVIKEKIKESSLLALESSASELNAKILTYQNRLEDDFESYDVQAKKLYADEIQIILKHLINFNGN